MWCRIRELGVFSVGAVGWGSADGGLASAGAADKELGCGVRLAQGHGGWEWVGAAARSVRRWRIVDIAKLVQHPGKVALHAQEQLLIGRCECLGHRAQGFCHVPADTTQLIDAPAAQARYEIALVVVRVLARYPALTIQPHQPA